MNPKKLFQGSFINDVAQIGGGGCNFNDAMYEGLIKSVIQVWQRFEGWGGSENIQIYMTSFLDYPLGEMQLKQY